MKADIHPKVFTDTQVVCACGNIFTTRSTKQSITVDVCFRCHPYFTGEHRFIDVKGRVEDFQKKQKLAKDLREKYGDRKSKKKSGTEEKDAKTLKELLSEI